MNRNEYPHKKLVGSDTDIETSLKEYNLAWIETETDYLFYYKSPHNVDRYFFATVEKDIDLRKEYDWADFDMVLNFTGGAFDANLLPQKISDLVAYYGPENVFGTDYWEGLIYPQVISGDQSQAKDVFRPHHPFTAEQIAGFCEHLDGQANIRLINKFYRVQDDSHLWPIGGRFNATERAIQRVRKIGTNPGVEYCYALESEISKMVNSES